MAGSFVFANKRTIVVYAPSLKFSGAQHVAQSIIHELGQRTDVASVHALVPAQRRYEDLESDKIHLHFVPQWLQLSPAFFLWNVMLRRLVRRVRPDAVINLANIAVAGLENQFVLLHWPHALHMDAQVWRRLPLRERALTRLKLAAFRRRLPCARGYFVQTGAAREALLRRYGVKSGILANALDTSTKSERTGSAQRADRRPRILVFSHYYPHKNLEIVEDLVRRVFALRLPYVFVLTVDPEASRSGAAFLDRLRWAIELRVVENRGFVPPSEIPELYGSSDILLLPTLLESFSTTYIEAMHFGIPIVTSDRGFARSVCGDAAIYIDPLDGENIIAALEALCNSGKLRAQLVASGRDIAVAQPNWSQVVEVLMKDVGSDLGWPQNPTAR
jgi:glycosyltransferase involved in cell wall biosynthesis